MILLRFLIGLPLVAACLVVGAAGAKPAAAQSQVDTTPPVLTSVNTHSTVDVDNANQFIVVGLCATDDLSGVANFYVILASPDGSQRVIQSKIIEVPSANYCFDMTMGLPRLNNPGTSFNPDSQPGTWSVFYIEVTDMAGNVGSFSQAQIARLGHTTFPVTNSFYSNTRPFIINGAIVTPTVSMSTPPTHTPPGTLPLAIMRINAADAVTQPTEGIDEVSARYCLPPVTNAQCRDGFILRGQHGSPVRSSIMFDVSAQPISSATGGIAQVGLYYLYSVSLQDMAGNVVLYQDQAFGGPYNLASYFGGNTIQLTP